MDADARPTADPDGNEGPVTAEGPRSSLVDRMHDAEYVVIGEMDVEGLLDFDDLPPVTREES